MTIFFPLFLLVVLVSVVASLSREGLWSNLVTLFNMILAGLLATTFYESLAGLLVKNMPTAAYFADFACIWILFAVTLGVFQSATSAASKVRVKFIMQLDVVGSWLLSIWIGWVFVCFLTMTLHMVPLAREYMWGGFVAEDHLMFGLAPDRKWLGLVHKASKEGFCRLASKDDGEKYVFDAQGKFIPMWAARRQQYSTTQSMFEKDLSGL